MKTLVCVKRVIDPYVKIRVKDDRTGVETRNVKMGINPFDEIALEEAIRLYEKGVATEIVVVLIGGSEAKETLLHALALGAHRAILVESTENDCSLNIAKILQKIVLREAPALVLMGKQTIDGDNSQTPQMLSALLDWPLGTFISALSCDGQRCTLTREVDGGLETLSLPLPAVISVDLRLNTPRYPTLPNIMKAKQKPLELIDQQTLGCTLKKHREVLRVEPPAMRQKGVLVESVDSLLEKLVREAKIIDSTEVR